MFMNEKNVKKMLAELLGADQFPEVKDMLRELNRKLEETNQEDRDFSALQDQIFELKKRKADAEIVNAKRLDDLQAALDAERQASDLSIQKKEQEASLAIERQQAEFDLKQKAEAEELRIKTDDNEREQNMKDRELKQLLNITEENMKIDNLKQQLKLQSEAKDLEVKLQRDYHTKIRAELKEAKADMRYIYDGIMQCMPNVNLDAQRVTSSHPLPSGTPATEADTAKAAKSEEE